MGETSSWLQDRAESLAHFRVPTGNERRDRRGGSIRMARGERRCGIILNAELDCLRSFLAREIGDHVESEINA
jgi:hypothetical protein